jgi:uncharacterized protein YdeI (BOF family)
MRQRVSILLEDFMKKRIQTLWLSGALILFVSMSIGLSAQQTQAPDPQAQQPAQTDQEQPSQKPSQTPDQQAPDSQAQASQSADAQSFTGTIVKSGDKYVFQDAGTGNTYDIDHQEEVQKFEGKRVKIHGTLDAANHMIHIQ